VTPSYFIPLSHCFGGAERALEKVAEEEEKLAGGEEGAAQKSTMSYFRVQ
jgi:hypothetical protein